MRTITMLTRHKPHNLLDVIEFVWIMTVVARVYATRSTVIAYRYMSVDRAPFARREITNSQ